VLAAHGFDLLGAEVARLPTTDDPVADLVDAGAKGFRTFIRKHPALFRITFQRVVQVMADERLKVAADTALGTLHGRIQRVREAGALGGRSIESAAVAFNAMCEGLANTELRGTRAFFPRGQEARVWRDSLESLVRGFAVTKHGGRVRATVPGKP
jgi:hypothetical protein